MGHVEVAAGVIVIIFVVLSITLLLLLSYQSIELLIHRRATEFLQHPTFPTTPLFSIPSDAYRSIMTLSDREPFRQWHTYGTYSDGEDVDVEKAEERTEETISDEKGFGHDRLPPNPPAQ